MFINLISGQPANIAKALRFGRKFLEARWQVTLSINIDAVIMLDPSGDLEPCPVSGQPLPEILKAFQAEGGRILVGNECLKLAGLSSETLPAGIEIAAFPLMQELMSIPDLKIITW